MARTSRLTRSEELVHRLEEEIFDGRLKPGTRLDEQELAQRFKVSRTPVREAIRHLVSSGLVAQRRHQGAVVKALTIAELFEMFQVMAELEGLCARLAARRMTAEERKRMLEVHQQCLEHLQAGDHVGFFESNNELHDVISAGSHNRFLDRKTQELRKRVNPYRYIITYQPGRMGDSDDEHEAVIRAIESHDGEEAHRLMRDHVNLLGESAADAIALLRAQGAMDDESEGGVLFALGRFRS